jgi:hypothetical protein
MTQLITWDTTGERYFETGVDHCVLYPMNESGIYPKGYAWNGITAITEKPSGAEANPKYADNIKYLNMLSAEEFAATIEAFTYPDAFAECDGSVEPGVVGLKLNQQTRTAFGLAYRTVLGNDIDGNDKGYKLHLIYGALAAPSEKAYQTINDSPEAITFSWELTTTPPAAVTGYKPTAHIVIDSLTSDPTKLAAFEVILYGVTGTPNVEGRLPLPAEVVTLLTPAGG